MADSDSRLTNLKAIMQWSLRQSDSGESTAMPMEPERQQWLREALESVVSAPSETDLLKAALAVLQAHAPPKGSAPGPQTEEEKAAVTTAFEDVQYFIEDLDHANDLIPLNGVQVIASYVGHVDASCRLAACDIIGTSCQNNPRAQAAFRHTLPSVMDLAGREDENGETRSKALYAVSCLTRDCEENFADFVKHGGLSLLSVCIKSPVKRLQLKSLFLLRSILTAEEANVDAIVVEDFVPCLLDVVKSGGDEGEVREMAALALCAAVRKSCVAMEQCVGDPHLKGALEARVQECSTAESEREAYQNLLQALSHPLKK